MNVDGCRGGRQGPTHWVCSMALRATRGEGFSLNPGLCCFQPCWHLEGQLAARSPVVCLLPTDLGSSGGRRRAPGISSSGGRSGQDPAHPFSPILLFCRTRHTSDPEWVHLQAAPTRWEPCALCPEHPTPRKPGRAPTKGVESPLCYASLCQCEMSPGSPPTGYGRRWGTRCSARSSTEVCL